MAQQQQQQQPRGAGGLGAGGLGGPGGLGGLAGPAGGAGEADTLRSPEAMAALRQRVMENPALLQQAVQAIVQQNPALAQYLNENPELLYQILAGAGEDDEGIEGQDGAGAEGFPRQQTIQLTQEEMDAIQRVSKLTYFIYLCLIFLCYQLQALGFTQQQAAEAYLACGKDEELAANYLFESANDD